MNADDFGASRQINEAILQAFQRGLISTASIMANMPGFEEACTLSHRHHLEGRIGLHLNLTSGKPLTTDIAACSRFCDAEGHWRPRRRVVWLTRKEALALEAEILGQIMTCEQKGITPTHLDSHHHMHCEWGILPRVVCVAKRHGIGSIRIAFNCGPGRPGASAVHHMLARVYRHVSNVYLRYHGLARTAFFGDVRDTIHVLKMTTADVEVMVHPMLDDCGQLVDLNGEDLESALGALPILADDIRAHYNT